MSVNTRRNDMVSTTTGRESAAKYVGHVLYQGGHPTPPGENNHRHVNQEQDSEGESLWTPNSGKISAVRRTFLLLTVFDVGLTFILWVIYTQLLNCTEFNCFRDQVISYNFKTSLFDTVMLSFVRFTLLNLSYALFRLNHWWTVALTTLMTSAFLIVKIFEFDFSSHVNNPLSYCLLIISFVLAWVETWFLDFKVLPQEKKDRERHRNTVEVITGDNERTPLLGNRSGGVTPADEYYSPIDSPEESEEEEEGNRDRFYSDANSRNSSRPHSSTSATSLDKIPDYLSQADKSWDILWSLLTTPQEAWHLEAGQDLIGGCVYSKQVDGLGKMFKLQVYIDISAKELWHDLVHNAPEVPDWNPTVQENRILCVIDDETDVCYSIASEGGGGLISSRDFVSLRRYGYYKGYWLSSGISTTHPDMPPQKKYVRGENLPGGWAFKEINEDRCLFLWFLNTNLKGWLPQKLVDQALSSVLFDYVTFVKKRVKTLVSQRT